MISVCMRAVRAGARIRFFNLSEQERERRARIENWNNRTQSIRTERRLKWEPYFMCVQTYDMLLVWIWCFEIGRDVYGQKRATTRNEKCTINTKTSLEGRALALCRLCARRSGDVVSLLIKTDFHLIDMWWTCVISCHCFPVYHVQVACLHDGVCRKKNKQKDTAIVTCMV